MKKLYIGCSNVAVIYVHVAYDLLVVGDMAYGLQWEIGKIFIRVVCMKASVFRFIQLKAQQYEGMITNLPKRLPKSLCMPNIMTTKQLEQKITSLSPYMYTRISSHRSQFSSGGSSGVSRVSGHPPF